MMVTFEEMERLKSAHTSKYGNYTQESIPLYVIS